MHVRVCFGYCFQNNSIFLNISEITVKDNVKKEAFYDFSRKDLKYLCVYIYVFINAYRRTNIYEKGILAPHWYIVFDAETALV